MNHLHETRAGGKLARILIGSAHRRRALRVCDRRVGTTGDQERRRVGLPHDRRGKQRRAAFHVFRRSVDGSLETYGDESALERLRFFFEDIALSRCVPSFPATLCG